MATVPPITVRPLTAADVEPARWVIYRAYAEVLLDLYGAEAAGQYEVRSRHFMALYLARDPEASFVAETAEGALAGAVFCFHWGEVGWFGSLGVAPEWQGKGVGQLLTARAIALLQQRGCRRLGLETWPSSPLVQHLYGKFGFVNCRSTVKLSRPVTGAAPAPGWQARWTTATSAAELPLFLQHLQGVTEAMYAAVPGEPQPDYRAECQAPIAAGWAEGLVIDAPDGHPVATALCYVRRPSGGLVTMLDARLLLVTPGELDGEALEAALGALDVRAIEIGAAGVTCDVNLRHARAAALLRQAGFRPIYELVRMERPTADFNPLGRSPLIECARWAG